MSDSGYRTENRCKVCGKHDCFEHATPAQVEGRMDDNRFDDCVRGEAFQTICAEALRARASESALLARAEKAEAACAEWREAWALATKSAVGIDRKPLDAVAHSPSPGSDLLERLRKAECANSIGNVLDGVRCKDIAALRAENERLLASLRHIATYPNTTAAGLRDCARAAMKGDA